MFPSKERFCPRCAKRFQCSFSCGNGFRKEEWKFCLCPSCFSEWVNQVLPKGYKVPDKDRLECDVLSEELKRKLEIVMFLSKIRTKERRRVASFLRLDEHFQIFLEHFDWWAKETQEEFIVELLQKYMKLNKVSLEELKELAVRAVFENLKGEENED